MAIQPGIKRVATAGAVGLLAGFVGVPTVLGVANTQWGEPGTAAYQVYEMRNRLMAVPLGFMFAGLMAFYAASPRRPLLGRLGRVSFAVALAGIFMLIVGNVLEFWVFTSDSYESASRVLHGGLSWWGVSSS